MCLRTAHGGLLSMIKGAAGGPRIERMPGGLGI
jgi:hypothetical protein